MPWERAREKPMREKLVQIAAGLCLVLLLGGCGTKGEAAEPPESPGAAAAEAAEASVEQTPAPAPTSRPPESAGEQPEEETATEEKTATEEETGVLRMKIGDEPVGVEWEDNESTAALGELCRGEPLTISLSRYGGFEQVEPIGSSLPRSDVQTVTQAGDVVLYAGNQIVVFYGSNSWAYTRLGRISDKSGEEMAALLGQSDTTLTLYWETEK